MHVETPTRLVTTMARYQMTVVFDVHEEVEMKYVYRELMDHDKTAPGSLAYEALKGTKPNHPHINKLYDDVIDRIDTSIKHPTTYNIVSFEKLKDQ
jgi:hypothetical protein